MSEQSNLYRLRCRYHIPLSELADASGCSNQYISCVELRTMRATKRLSEKMDQAMEALIANRKQELLLLEADFLRCRGRLLQAVEDESNE